MRDLKLKILVVFFAIGLAFTACSDPHDQEGDPPAIPSAESMTVNFEGLNSANKMNSVQQTETHIGVAYFSALAAGIILEANFAIPKALLSAAENENAEYLGDGEWQWSYSASGDQGSFSVRLTAQTKREEVEWNFYVSTTSTQVNWDDVLLFSGTSTYDGNEGTWNIFNPVTETQATSSSWELSESSASITLSVFDSSGAEIISRIVYTSVGTSKTVLIQDLTEDTETTIEWDADTGVGSITSTNYNNGERACWDENFQNAVCS